MKYASEMGSGAMMYTPSFIKFAQAWGYMDSKVIS
jgi:hypothetical protein